MCRRVSSCFLVTANNFFHKAAHTIYINGNKVVCDSNSAITLLLGSIGSEVCYKWNFYNGILGKWPFDCHFPMNPL